MNPTGPVPPMLRARDLPPRAVVPDRRARYILGMIEVGRIALGCALAACATTNKRHTTVEVATDRSLLIVSCDFRETCDSTFLVKDGGGLCGNVKNKCLVTEVVDGKRVRLLEADGIHPLVFDPTHNVLWMEVKGQPMGVTTSASQRPGQRVAAPAGLRAFAYWKVTADRILVSRNGFRFTLWNPADARTVDVLVPWPSQVTELEHAIGDQRIGFCGYEFGPDVQWWASVDVAASLATGTPQLATGSAPMAGEDSKTCAMRHAQPSP